MHRLGAVDFITLWTLARTTARVDDIHSRWSIRGNAGVFAILADQISILSPAPSAARIRVDCNLCELALLISLPEHANDSIWPTGEKVALTRPATPRAELIALAVQRASLVVFLSLVPHSEDIHGAAGLDFEHRHVTCRAERNDEFP